MRLILEAHAGRLEHAAALDVDAFMAVDEDVVDGLVLEQRFERTEAGHLIENFRYEIVEFLSVKREPLGQDVLRHQLLDVAADFVFGKFFQRRQIDLLDQPAMQPHLGVKELVGQQRIGGGRSGRLLARPPEFGFGKHRPGHALKRGIFRSRDRVPEQQRGV